MKLQLLDKWNIYQKERFPVIKYAILVAAFAMSGLSLSYLLTDRTFLPTLPMFGTAFVVTFLLFLQLRLADEHKDHEHDMQFHPERPVPRGLVSLDELKGLALITGAIQLIAAAALSVKLLIPLMLAWGYLYLMTKEFFIGDWLRSQPVAYMVTHMCILFFTDLFITSCHWLVVGVEPPIALVYFLATSFFLGIVIEVGRKIKSPQEESSGSDTYSSIWGRKQSVLVWLISMCLSALMALTTSAQINSVNLTAPVLVLLFLAACFAGDKFLKKQTPENSHKLDTLSGIWTLATYLFIGLVPLLVSLLPT